MSEAWVTDDDLRAARERFAAQIPGLVMPVAYGVARKDPSGLTFGHVNALGAVRPLPAVVLASVCGYVAMTGVYRLDHERFAEAVERLTPAEAATHMPHPNLWSWRDLLTDAGPDATFLAFFVASPDDPPVDQDDAQFRQAGSLTSRQQRNGRCHAKDHGPHPDLARGVPGAERPGSTN